MAAEVLEWYDFGQAEWRHVTRGASDFVLGTVLPVGSFYLLYRLFSFPVAVLAVLVWTACVFTWHYWRTRTLDVFSLTTLVLACIKASAGVASGDVRLYLVWPSLENLFWAGVFLCSALLGRPLLGMYAQRLYPIPSDVSRSAEFQHGFLGASIAWALVSLLRASLRLWLVMNLAVGVFLLVDSVIGWPVYAVLIWFSAWYPLRVLRQSGHVLP
jgi:intracellular septation protein A